MPGYWMYEVGGELKSAVAAYLNDQPLSLREIALFRAYLIQWIDADVWAESAALAELRRSVLKIQTPRDITVWLAQAMEEGIDPL